VFVLKRTGVVIAARTRNDVPLDAVVVMGATLLGSVDTLITALGGTSPATVSVAAAGRRLFVMKVGASDAILLVGPEDMSDRDLQRRAKRIARRLGSAGGPE
jgi:predicted regulator of Ras-like GTPase activity (Roadblock/LC7/MglB family)